MRLYNYSIESTRMMANFCDLPHMSDAIRKMLTLLMAIQVKLIWYELREKVSEVNPNVFT